MVAQVHNPLAGKHGFERFQGWLEQLPHPIFIRSGLQQVGNSDLAPGSVTGDKIANLTITGNQIADASITGQQIANATIAGLNIIAATITGSLIALATIAGSNIGSATVTATNIANATITAAQIAAGTITGGNIASGTITGGNISSLTITAGNIANLTITAGQIASATITGAKIANATITDSNIVASTITGASIAAGTITAGNMVVGTITAASGIIADINADTITSGAIRAINVNAASHTTLGSYFSSSVSAAAATVNVKNTTDFPNSGTAHVIDTTNDRDDFTYTGKTATTLTGCSGVLAHNSGATVIPKGSKCMVVDGPVNEMRFYGDRGDGTVQELSTIGYSNISGDFSCASFGSATGTGVRVGLEAKSVDSSAIIASSAAAATATILGTNTAAGPTIQGDSSGGSGSGGWFNGNATAGNLRLPTCNGSTFPTSKTADQIATVGDRQYYSDGSHWLPLNQPYFESSEQTVTATSNVSVSHGLTDGAGNNRTPHNVYVVIRCKTAELGYSVGDEVPIVTEQAGGVAGAGVWANTTTVGLAISNGISVVNRTTWAPTFITAADWKIVFYAS